MKSQINYILGYRETRPWGTFKVIHIDDEKIVKIIKIYPSKRLSLQRHKYRNEFWIVMQGKAKIICGNKTYYLEEKEYFAIPKNTWHRIENIGADMLEIMEIQTGSILDEKDIERKEDDYGRIQ